MPFSLRYCGRRERNVCRNFGYCASLFGLIAQHWKPKYFVGNFDDDVGTGGREGECGNKGTRRGGREDEILSGADYSLYYDFARRINAIIRFFLGKTERSISDSYDSIFVTRCDVCRQMCIRKRHYAVNTFANAVSIRWQFFN